MKYFLILFLSVVSLQCVFSGLFVNRNDEIEGEVTEEALLCMIAVFQNAQNQESDVEILNWLANGIRTLQGLIEGRRYCLSIGYPNPSLTEQIRQDACLMSWNVDALRTLNSLRRTLNEFGPSLAYVLHGFNQCVDQYIR